MQNCMKLAGGHFNLYIYQYLIVVAVEKERVVPLWSLMTRKFIASVTGNILLKEYVVTLTYFVSFKE